MDSYLLHNGSTFKVRKLYHGLKFANSLDLADPQPQTNLQRIEDLRRAIIAFASVLHSQCELPLNGHCQLTHKFVLGLHVV